MKNEIQSAVDFLTNILRLRDDVHEIQTHQFHSILKNLLSNRYQDHWFPEKPSKGSAYRCIRLNHKMDPLILEAGKMCGLNLVFLETTFPPELTIWVDPRDVSYRIGENGSVGVLYQADNDAGIETQISHFVQQPSHSFVRQQNCTTKTLNSTLMSCKDQFMSALPSISSEAMHSQQFVGFISS